MNNTKIIPTVFAYDKTTFKEKFNALKNISKTLHLDFMDGTYTKNKTISINEMIEIISSEKNLKFGLHLMAKNPISYLKEIKKINPDFIYIHFEAIENDVEITNQIKTFKKNLIKTCLVIEANTPISKIQKFVQLIDGVMFMGIVSGLEGQKFIPQTIDKIKDFKTKNPDVKIDIDGGINFANIKKLSKLKINNICIGSYISKDTNLALQNYNNLKKIILLYF